MTFSHQGKMALLVIQKGGTSSSQVNQNKKNERNGGGKQVLGAEVEHGSQNLHNQDSGGF